MKSGQSQLIKYGTPKTKYLLRKIPKPKQETDDTYKVQM
jgi:hypothetical protein